MATVTVTTHPMWDPALIATCLRTVGVAGAPPNAPHGNTPQMNAWRATVREVAKSNGWAVWTTWQGIAVAYQNPEVVESARRLGITVRSYTDSYAVSAWRAVRDGIPELDTGTIWTGER